MEGRRGSVWRGECVEGWRGRVCGGVEGESVWRGGGGECVERWRGRVRGGAIIDL